jgi:signal transduction histidine kinase
MFALSATVVGLYLAIWLDWTIGLDLYLSSSAKTNDRIQSAIRAAVITSGLVSVFALMICVFGYRRINERVPGHVRAD